MSVDPIHLRCLFLIRGKKTATALARSMVVGSGDGCWCCSSLPATGRSVVVVWLFLRVEGIGGVGVVFASSVSSIRRGSVLPQADFKGEGVKPI